MIMPNMMRRRGFGVARGFGASHAAGAVQVTVNIGYAERLWRQYGAVAAAQMLRGGSTLVPGRTGDIQGAINIVTNQLSSTISSSDWAQMQGLWTAAPSPDGTNMPPYWVNLGISDALAAQPARMTGTAASGASGSAAAAAAAGSATSIINPTTGLPAAGPMGGPAAVSPTTGLPLSAISGRSAVSPATGLPMSTGLQSTTVNPVTGLPASSGGRSGPILPCPPGTTPSPSGCVAVGATPRFPLSTVMAPASGMIPIPSGSGTRTITCPDGSVVPVGMACPRGPISQTSGGGIDASTGLPVGGGGGGGGGGSNYVDTGSSNLCWDGSAPEDNAGGVCTPDQSQWPIDPTTGLPVDPSQPAAVSVSPAAAAQDASNRAAMGIPIATTPAPTDWNTLLQTTGPAPAPVTAPLPSKPATGLGLAAGGGAAGFLVGGPIGAAVGAVVGFLVGKPKAPPPVAPMGDTSVDANLVPVQYTAGGAPVADVSPTYYSPDDGSALAPPPGFPGSPDLGPTSPPPGFPLSTQYQTGGYSAWKRRRR